MGHKKYYSYKKPEEYYSERFYDDTGRKVGIVFSIAFHNGKFSMVLLDWGGKAEYERSRDGEVEQNWYFDEENTKKLMLRTGTKNGRDLIAELKRRFGEHKDSAYHYIEKFCEAKEIKYDYYVHY